MPSCDIECNKHGSWISGDCSCDLGWFDSNSSCCIIKGNDLWKQGWDFFVIFFNILYSIIFTYSFLKLYCSLKREKTSWRNKMVRMFKSPKNLSLLSICLISLVRVIWLSFDPLIFKGKSNRMIDRLLFETAYPLLFTVLSSVLLVWSGMYQGIRKKKYDPFKYIRKIIIGFMIIAYPVTWIVSINKGLHKENESWYLLGYISLAICSFFVTLMFVLYAILLIRYIDRPNKSKNYCQSNTLKSPKKMLTTMGEINMEIEERVDDMNERNKNIYKSFECLNEKKIDGDHNKTEADDDKYFLQLSIEDKKIIKKLLAMSTAAGISGLVIIGVGTPFTIKNSIISDKMTYFGIFLAFSIEVGICLLINIAFTTQIKNPDKENIKQTAYIARTIRNQAPNIKVSREYQHISKRLELYYN
ncbi:hypothetical protein SteCoe_29031 [Stentor coeruleus]|uniref:Uncharacterized protein n=1 Tax=Stentor coeruleus TaxID=5963 RepID=A0A1R2B6W8_9CILI|nr:hypothetical protein SteCoe_29031 [Stentor coeruleus]